MRQSGIAKLTLWVSCLFAPYLVGCTTNRCIAAQDQQEVVAPFPVPATGVYELVLEISEKNIEKLQQENRPYVRAKLGERDGSDSGTVGVKLKGAAGSYQGFDGKPGFTVNMDKYEEGRRFHGLDKYHLNNSVQDPSYLSEWIGSEIFRRAGYPAPQVTHALVRINDRPMELYVFREGYDKNFLRRHFSDASGNLYDGGFCQDIDQDLERDEGDGVDDHSDLKSLAEGLAASDFLERQRIANERLDMDRFLSFMVLEFMLCHWDGYSNSANNYRMYFDPETDQAVFLPHGMDQLFGDLGMGLFDWNGAMVARLVMGSDALRARYRARARELIAVMDPPESLFEAIDKKTEQLKLACGQLGDAFIAELGNQSESLKQRIRERVENLRVQLEEEEPEPVRIASNESIPLDGWYPVLDGEGMTASPSDEVEPKNILEIRLDNEKPGFGSWRAAVLLKAGKYRFRARFQVRDVVPIDQENLETVVVGCQYKENWMRLSDFPRKARSGREGGWHEVPVEFDVVEDRANVEFLVGIRGKQGSLKVDSNSLVLERL